MSLASPYPSLYLQVVTMAGMMAAATQGGPEASAAVGAALLGSGVAPEVNRWDQIKRGE